MLGFMRRRLGRAAALGWGLSWVLAAGGARADLGIDLVDTNNFNKKGEMVFFLDLLRDDESRAVYREQDPDGAGFKLSLEGEEVAGTWKVQTFREANQAMSIGVLMAATSAIATWEGILDEEKKGFKDFFSQLTEQDKVLAKFYTDKSLENIRDWTSGAREVISGLDKIAVVEKEEGVTNVPRLLKHIDKMVDAFGEDSEGLRRKVLVVFTDGLDANTENASATEKLVTTIVDKAKPLGLRIYVVHLYDDPNAKTPEPLQQLSSRTNGVYRAVTKDFAAVTADTVSELGKELANQYVATFKPTEYRGSEAPVELLLEVTPTKGGGDKVLKAKIEKQKIPQRDTDWMGIAKIGGMVVGGLLGLVLLVWGIRKFLNRERKQTVVHHEEAVVGAYKGRLLVTAGAYAGREFFITEEVTTIGAMAGNTIVLAEGGVSKRHAGIKVDDMRFELADLGSTNGTYVNGAKVTKQFLRDGDEIRLGENKLKFSLK